LASRDEVRATLKKKSSNALVVQRRVGHAVVLEKSADLHAGSLQQFAKLRKDGTLVAVVDERGRGFLWDAVGGRLVWSSPADVEVPVEKAFAATPPPGLRCRAGDDVYAFDVCADIFRPIEEP